MKKAGLAAGPQSRSFLPGLKIKPDRQLNNAVAAGVTRCIERLSEGVTDIHEVVAARPNRPRVQEIRMVQQVKKVRVEPETHPFIDPEGLADPEINVRETWPRNRIPAQVGIAPETTVIIDCRIVQAIGRLPKLRRIQVLIGAIHLLLDDGT